MRMMSITGVRPLVVALVLLKAVVLAHDDLYSDRDAVITLDGDDIQDYLVNSDTAWFVNFYLQWCGHCRTFAPVWKQLALETRSWSSVVRVAAVDCSIAENRDACSQYDVTSFPTLKLIAPGSSGNMTGLEVRSDNLVSRLHKTALDFVSGTSFQQPESWPQFQPFLSLEQLALHLKGRQEIAVLIIESSSSTLGREVTLEMSAYRDQLSIYRMENASIFRLQENTPLPIMFRLDAEGKQIQQLQKPANTTTAGFVSAIRRVIGVNPDTPPVRYQEGEIREEPSTPMVILDSRFQHLPNATMLPSLPTGPAVHMQDLESGLHYALRQEVATRRLIQGEVFLAVKNFVHVLSKYFGGSDQVNRFLTRLDEELQKITSHSISGIHWLHMLDNLQDLRTFLPPRITWSGCAGSKPGLRGYPCSMWTLFHRLTVSAARHQGTGGNPHEVLLAMRDYIHLLFGCKECSENFMKMAATLQSEVKSMDGAILWLWNAHNKANKRLHGDETEDPKHKKIQFPSNKQCPSCWIVEPTNIQWNETAVLTFMKNMYNVENTIQDAAPMVFDPKVHATNIREKNISHTHSKSKADQPKVRVERSNAERIERFRQQRMETLKLRQDDDVNTGESESLDLSSWVVILCFCLCIILYGYYCCVVRNQHDSVLPFFISKKKYF